MKKKISVVIPTYNEEGNVKPLAESIVAVMETELPEYRYEILFIDNHSKDRTRMYLRELCAKNKISRRSSMPETLGSCAHRSTD